LVIEGYFAHLFTLKILVRKKEEKKRKKKAISAMAFLTHDMTPVDPLLLRKSKSNTFEEGSFRLKGTLNGGKIYPNFFLFFGLIAENDLYKSKTIRFQKSNNRFTLLRYYKPSIQLNSFQ